MKIIVPLAPGFEEIEAVTIIDILRRGGLEVTTAHLGGNPVTGSHSIAVTADRGIDTVNASDYGAVVLPGGMPGSANLRDSGKVIDIIRAIHGAGGYAAAICAAPIVLAAAGILEGKTATCYPGYEKDIAGVNWTGEPVVSDGRIITGRGAGCAVPFALKLVELFKNAETSEELKKSLQVYWM